MTVKSNKVRVLAVASAGGHWVQLFRMRPAWDDCDVAYLTTTAGYFPEIEEDAKIRQQKKPNFYAVWDANLDKKLRLIIQLCQILIVLLKERPNVIISTGAAPGFFALKFGKLIGARTIWVDSIANAETLSLSGEKAENCADLWLTQWEHLSNSDKNSKRHPDYKGSVV